MNSPRRNPHLLAVIGLTATTIAWSGHALQAAVTLQGNDAFIVSGAPTGDLTVSGDLSVVKGIDFGTTVAEPALAAVQLNYTGGIENAAKFDLTPARGAFQWRDNLVGTTRDKMLLDGGNLLTLYKSDGTGAGILLNPDTCQIHLSGAGGGIYAGGTPVFTIAANGSLVFGGRPFNIAAATLSGSSSTGAMTVAGGIGVAMDSHVNGIRVGRGGGNVATNTGFGANTLQANTTGCYNTATGYYALSNNTLGTCNTATGFYALSTNMTGTCNTAAGYYALRANTTGNSNTSAGYCSMYANTTGYYNTASGYCSLYRNNTGNSNTASGYCSLSENYTGNSNTASGYYSLWSNSLGCYNTASGTYALGSNRSGFYNTAAGHAALQSNTTGGNNVAIGASAGKYQANGSSSLNAPNNSIYLGANSRGFSNLDQNSIVIGSAAVGEGANTTVIGNISTVKTRLHGGAAVGRHPGSWGSATDWVETDPLLLVGNGSTAALTSNAITTLKNGQTTLTNKQWKENAAAPLADPVASTDSGGEALVVEGHTRLRGKVTIEQAQGDISMGIYGP